MAATEIVHSAVQNYSYYRHFPSGFSSRPDALHGRGTPGQLSMVLLPMRITSAFSKGVDEIDELCIVETEEATPFVVFTLASATPNGQRVAEFEFDHSHLRESSPIYPRTKSNDATGDTTNTIDVDRSLTTQEEERSELSCDDDHPGTSPLTDKSHDAGRGEDNIFACPFFKNNSHRWKNVQSCTQPYTLSRLKQHLTGSGRPHTLHECATCLTCFADTQSLQAHENEAVCSDVPQYYPAEGVGRRLSEQFEKQPRGPRPATYHKDRVIVWEKWYSTLFGTAEPIPSYNFGRSSDPSLQHMYRQRLRLTLLRPVHMSHKMKALDRHWESQKEVEMLILKRLIGEDVIEQVETARCQLNSAKRKPSGCKEREQAQVSRRRTSRTSAIRNISNKSSLKEHQPGRPEHALERDRGLDAMNDELEGPSMLDTSYQPFQTTEPWPPATLATFPANARISAFSITGHDNGSCDPHNDSQLSTFPCGDWPMPEDNFLPTKANVFDGLLPFNPNPSSIGTQLAVQLEGVAATEMASGLCWDKRLLSTADRLALLPSYSNTLFPSADPGSWTMSEGFDGGPSGDS
ncbi:hypothetical protein P171DRAFT_444972 [Karstenula rhodostoma CBS 690.94]|uniref:C2H2-type domain-containing protein n=1 Tax=Karstenula rhodostoma CBS 690.94 TaxID=1392251 RepID=A0A9P4UAT1_9PLEO|nr:hypothetical protein P171DRAFT_444972 [Karstenula rhodostoma CBS 690.94]